ncbi:LEAF RUST 10 DISEASE-RESISTANCE LOCUS RECEPTOR-LIKE PROTEIN KINASE-like 2.3, partial [Cucurbita argyrosperma subsp. argyrosperma]
MAGDNDVWKKYVIGFSCGFGGVTIMSVAFFIWFRLHKKKLARTYTPSSFLLRNNSSNLPGTVADHLHGERAKPGELPWHTRVRDMICGVAELAFQCLQSVKDTRPTMSEALEILKNIESQHSGQGKTEEINVSGEEDVVVKGDVTEMTPSLPLFLFFFFFTIVWYDLPLCFGDGTVDEFKACDVYYNCGDFVNITYPFWGNERPEFCGRREFELNCKDNRTTAMEISSIEFHVLNIRRSNHTMTIARSDLRTDYCPKNEIKTATIDYRLFKYSLNDLNLSVWYDCPLLPGILDNYRFTCGLEEEIRGRANYAFETEALNRSRNMSECRLNIEVTITKEVFEETHKNRTMAVEQGVKSFTAFVEMETSILTFAEIFHANTQAIYLLLNESKITDFYKGKLPDGRDVAVKLLNESKSNGEEFMNEVVSFAKTSHVNIATLLGFCYERNKRALIYDYMAKGSLDKYISSNRIQEKGEKLDWNTLYNIVIGVARGLEYLHRGCNTRILHFDIKPHNILLDDDFCPKITDFGLAKQCRAKESHVSMTCVKGTIGFIAPEIIFRNLGKVSHKSDVYSYGMLVLEMVGERKSPNQGVEQSSDEYFPDWIYKDLTQSEIHGGCWWGNTEEEEEMARKMIIVGLCCIQTLPGDRPSMTDAVSMLEGSVDGLQIPPKPDLFGPPAADLLQVAASSSSTSDNALDAFKDCGVNYNCGELVNITYPFWGNERQSSCGRKEFKLNCNNNRTTTTYINSLEYNVLEIKQLNNTMRIARSDLFNNYCPRNQIQVASMDHHPFAYSARNQNISVGYNCSADNEFPISEYNFSCGGEWERRGRVNYAFKPSAAVYSKLVECEMKIEVMVTIKGLKEGVKNRRSLVETAVKGGFEVEYENWYKGACDSCNGSGGNCGGNGTYPFYCICRNGVANPYACDATAAPPRPPHPGAGSGIGGIVMMSIIFFIRLRMHKKKHQNYSCDRPMKELEKIEHYMALSLFSYHELVKATDKFNPANELGDGGFGTANSEMGVRSLLNDCLKITIEKLSNS